MSGEGQSGRGVTDALTAGVNYLTGSSNTTATGNSAIHQDGVEHIQNKLNERDPNTISTPGLSSQDTPGTSSRNFPLNTSGSTSQSGLSQEGRPQTLPTSELEQRELVRGERGEQTGLPRQVADSYRTAPDVAPQTTGSAEAIHDKREVQQELEGIVAQPAPATSEGVGHGTGAALGSGVISSSHTGAAQSGAVAPQSATGTHGVHGSGYPAVGTEQTVTGIHPGAYTDSGVRGGGVGTTNQTGGVGPVGGASTLSSAPGQYNQGVDFTGHRSAEEVAGHVAGLDAESTRGVPAPKAGWHPDSDAAADGSERGAKDLSAPGFTAGAAHATSGAGLADRTRDDPAFDKSGHSTNSDLTAGAAGLGAGAVLSNSTRDDPAHDPSGTFVPTTQLDGSDRQAHTSEHHTSALGAAAGGAGLAAGVAGAEATRLHDNDTTRKERTDPTDIATDKFRRDPTHSASDDAVLGSSAAGHQASRGETGTSASDLNSTSKERTDPTDSATEKLRKDPAHSASDDHVLGSDAQGAQANRGEHVDHKHPEGHQLQPTSTGKDDPYWQGKESAREHLEHEAREGRTVKENPDSIPTAGGEKLGRKHWGESKKLPE